jgi:AcrR family transcriptional regulator
MNEEEGDRAHEPERRPGGRSARIRTAVFEAALDLIGRRGLSGFTIAELAKESGVHETTIYRRWGSVERIILDSLIERMEAEIPHPDMGSFRADMVASMRRAIDFYATPMGKILIRALGSVGDEANDLKRAFWKTRRESIEPMLSRARSRGEIAPEQDGDLLFEAMIGQVFLRLLVTGENLEPEMSERIVDAVLR